MTATAGSTSVLRELCAVETCCLPMDRALTAAGFTMHPNCEFPAEPAKPKRRPKVKKQEGKPAAAGDPARPAPPRPDGLFAANEDRT